MAEGVAEAEADKAAERMELRATPTQADRYKLVLRNAGLWP